MLVGGEGPPGLIVAYSTLDQGAELAPFAPSSSLALQRRDVACATAGDFVYVFGGTAADGAQAADIQRARINGDGSLGSFEVMPFDQLVARRGHQAVSLPNAIVLVGGANSVNGDLSSTEVFGRNDDGLLFAPLAGPTMQRARRGPRLAVIAGDVYVVGGRTGFERTWEVAPIDAGGAGLGSFTSSGTLMGANRGFYISAVAGVRFYAIGSSTTLPIDRAVASSGALGAFTNDGALTLARENGMAAAVGDRVLAIGGFISDGMGTSSVLPIEAAPLTPTTMASFASTTMSAPNEVTTGACAVRAGDFVHLVGGSGLGGVLATSAVSARIVSP